MMKHYFFYPVLVALLLGSSISRAGGHTIEAERLKGDYKLYLYFGDSTPFLDELRLEVTEGKISGRMHVPNDFDADIERVGFDGKNLSFEILVPKNSARPVDMVFRYEATLFPGDPGKMAGFIRLAASDGKPVSPMPYLGSIVLFRRSQ